jgi:hypothetical protein
MRLPGMLHGRVVRPRGQRAYGAGSNPERIDELDQRHPRPHRAQGHFVGVVAEREWDAVKAARVLKVTWQETAALLGNADLSSACVPPR